MKNTRNLSLFTAANVFTFTLFWLIQINLTWLAFELTGSEWLLGLMGFAVNIPLLVLMPWAGVYSDKYNRKVIMIVCQCLYLLPSLALFFLSHLEKMSYWGILFIGTFYGVFLALAKPATDATVYDISEGDKELKMTVSFYSATRQVALLFTPLLSQWILARYPFAAIFIVCALANIIAAILFAGMKPNVIQHNGEDSSTFQSMRSGWRYIADHASLKPVVALIACALAIAIAIQFQFPAMIKVFGGSKQDLYHFYLASAVGGIAGALFVLLRDYNEHQTRLILAVSLLGQAAALVALSFIPTLTWGYGLIFSIDAFAMIATIIGTIAIQNGTDDQMRGRVMSFLNMARIGAIPVASLLIGISTQCFGPMIGISVFGALFALFIIYYEWFSHV